MRRALLLADWLNIHQEQCWRLLTPQAKKMQPEPVEFAIMSVIVELAATRGKVWQITNKELFSLVRGKLDTPEIKDSVLGRAATKLGIADCRIGKTERGRRISKKNILSFRSAVSAVIPVRESTRARLSEDD